MKTSAVSARHVLGLVLLSALLPWLAAGCSERAAEAPKGHTYTLRARVDEPPTPGSLYLTHEAVDDWVGRSGKVEGMSSMSMPFPVAKEVSLEGIQNGDVVEIQLHVDWDADLAVQITSLRKLPRDTRLVFRDAKPQP